MPKLIYYKKKCIGCGICYEMLPGYWRMSVKDGKAVLLKANMKNDIAILPINQNMNERATALVKACPGRGIKLSK